VTLRTDIRVCVTHCALPVPPGAYSVERYRDGTWVNETGAVTRLPPDVQLTANNTPVLQPNGSANSMATFAVSNAIGTYRVTVAITGRVKVCAPNEC
jgi:hypothetical protein